MRAQRGTTVIEVMVAAAVLLVAVVGLAAVLNHAAHATAIGHRRTVVAYARQALLDRLAVMPRDRIALLSAGTWIVGACYDADSQPVATNTSLSDTFTACADGTAKMKYRSWLQIAPSATFSGTRAWDAQVYAERVDPGCAADERTTSIHCVAADVLLTD